MSIPINDLMSAYIKMRDAIGDIDKKAKAEKSELAGKLDKIELHFAARMKEQGVKSLATDAGTAFTKLKDSVTIEDKVKFRWALAQQLADALVDANLVAENAHNAAAHALTNSPAFDLLTLSANKTNCKAFMGDNEGLMPDGVKYFSENVVQVRRS